MKWFINFATQVKLLWSFGLMVLLLTVVIVAAYSGITAIHEAQQNLYEQDFAIAVALKEVRSNQNGSRAALLTMIAAEKPSDRDVAHREIRIERKNPAN